MAFQIEFTQPAADHVRAFRKFEQQIILDAVEEHLRHEPSAETRNKKRLGKAICPSGNCVCETSPVFYDVVAEEDRQIVKIAAVGHKEHGTLTIGGREVQL
jgi:hypothetical protein